MWPTLAASTLLRGVLGSKTSTNLAACRFAFAKSSWCRFPIKHSLLFDGATWYVEVFRPLLPLNHFPTPQPAVLIATLDVAPS